METPMYPPVTQVETRSAERLDQLRLIEERFRHRQAGTLQARQPSRLDPANRIARLIGTFGQRRARRSADRSAAEAG
jgi:hypothetical protein